MVIAIAAGVTATVGAVTTGGGETAGDLMVLRRAARSRVRPGLTLSVTQT